MKVLSSRVHGYLDYALVVAFATAPTLFGFAGLPATLSYVIAALQLALSLVTNYPLGVSKIVPFVVHGALEFAGAVFLLTVPWLIGFSVQDSARNFYVGAGLVMGVMWLTTNYRAVDDAMLDNNYPPARRGPRSPTELGYGTR